MRRQVLQLLFRRHCNAALGAGHDHRLGNFRHGQLGFQLGGGGKGGADAGDDFVIHPFLFQNPHLLQDGPVQGRIAALDAGHRLALGYGGQGNRHNFVQGQIPAAVNSGISPGQADDGRMHQGIGIDDHFGGFNQPLGLEGQQFRVAGTAADEINFAAGHIVTF